MKKGVLIDIDGTLILSNDAHTNAWVDALKEFGYSIPFEAIRPLMGMGGDKLLPQIIPGIDADAEKSMKISERRKEIFLSSYVESLHPTPGARELIEKFHHHNLRTIIATSAHEDELRPLLEKADVKDLLTDWTTSSDVSESKPAPDIVAVALEKIQLDSSDVIMLGDTPFDIISAKKCNVSVIAFRTGGFSDEKLSEAAAIYDSPQDLLTHYESSPLAR